MKNIRKTSEKHNVYEFSWVPLFQDLLVVLENISFKKEKLKIDETCGLMFLKIIVVLVWFSNKNCTFLTYHKNKSLTNNKKN